MVARTALGCELASVAAAVTVHILPLPAPNSYEPGVFPKERRNMAVF